jgi:3-oxoacyl-[acyl-carrier protein] reductase
MGAGCGSTIYDFKGQTGLITGAASGIGLATAVLLAGRGAELALADLSEPGLAQAADRIKAQGGPAPLAFKLDVSSWPEVQEVVAQTKKKLGRIDFLVTSAGILRRTAFHEISPEEWELMMAVNLRGPFLCCRAVVPVMLEQGRGNIVNVSSLAGRTCSVLGGAHYTTVKHGVVGLSRHIARELGPKGIRVNAFCPGSTLTPMTTLTTTEEERTRIFSALPLRRWAEPEEQAKVIAFLLSDESSYVTGAAVDSNGGAVML